MHMKQEDCSIRILETALIPKSMAHIETKKRIEMGVGLGVGLCA